MEYHLYSLTATYGSTPCFISRNVFPDKGFASLYAVSSETAEAIKQAGTAKGFKGVVWSERLWLDFDSYEAADRAESRIESMGYDVVVYDTGGRGAHYGIRRDHAPSHLLPLKDRQWVKTEFPEADSCIYTHLHPFRLEGTKHDKTGNTKRLVRTYRGGSLVLPELKKEHMHVNENRNIQGRGKSIFDCFRVVANSVPCKNGERHPQLIRLIYALRDEAQVGFSEACWWASEVNKLFEEPKEDHEIEKAVRSIYE